jgi:YbbR domain-containing protein
MANKLGDRQFRQNLTIHALAILLTIAMWSFVKTADFTARPETSVSFESVPLEVRDIPAGLVLTNDIPQSVSVVLRGTSSVVDQVLKENLLAYISLGEAGEGVGQYAVKVIHPQGLTASPAPGRLEVRLERELTADFDIRLEGLDPADPSYYLEVTPNPAFIQVTGLRSLFEKVQQAQVVINPASIKESGTLQLPVRLLSARGQEVTGLVTEPGVIALDVVVFPGKLLPIEIDFTDELAEGYALGEVQIEPEAVYVYAAEEVLATLERVMTEPVSLADLTADTTLELKLISPPDLVDIAAKEVQVSIKVSG